MRRLLPRLALPVWWLVCFTLTHANFGPHVGPDLPLIDKCVHFSMYFGLAVCFRWLRQAQGKGFDGRAYARIYAVLLLYGAADEITQAWVGRDTEAFDFAADALGAMVGLLAFTAPRYRRAAPTTG
jgi:VanZ family protein